MSTNDDKTKSDKSSGNSAADNEISTTVKKASDLNASGTGLTQQLGKPIVDKEEMAKRAAEIREQYQSMKHKKLAQSAITSSIGDLLGGPSKPADEDEKTEES